MHLPDDRRLYTAPCGIFFVAGSAVNHINLAPTNGRFTAKLSNITARHQCQKDFKCCTLERMMGHLQGRNIGNYNTMIHLPFLKVRPFLITGIFLIYGFTEFEINIHIFIPTDFFISSIDVALNK